MGLAFSDIFGNRYRNFNRPAVSASAKQREKNRKTASTLINLLKSQAEPSALNNLKERNF